MLPLKKIWLRLFLWSGLVLVLVFLMIILPVFWERVKAGRILNEVRAERWSSVNFEKAREISERYGGHPGVFGRRGLPCSENSCRFDIAVSNFPMDCLHLTPKTGFYVSINVQHNRVAAVSSDLLSIILGGSPLEPAPLGAHVVEDIVQTDPSAPGFSAVRSSGDTPGGSIINVALNASATAQERQAAYDFSLDCLTKLRGCKHAEDFLPQAAGMVPR